MVFYKCYGHRSKIVLGTDGVFAWKPFNCESVVCRATINGASRDNYGQKAAVVRNQIILEPLEDNGKRRRRLAFISVFETFAYIARSLVSRLYTVHTSPLLNVLEQCLPNYRSVARPRSDMCYTCTLHIWV